jgi:uncharacterized protein (DUF2147 family)
MIQAYDNKRGIQMNIKTLLACTVVAVGLITPAMADPIEANWKRPNGIIVKFSKCGGSFCASPITGPNAGKSAGKMASAGDGAYKGSLTDLENNKTYSGKATISGATLRVSGCVLGGLLCKGENWVRQ